MRFLPLNEPAATIARPAEDLQILAEEISIAHQAVEEAGRKALEQAKRAGDALHKAKKLVGHGNWLAWLAANAHFSRMTASRYMRVAAEWGKCNTLLNLTDALRVLTEDPDESKFVIVTSFSDKPSEAPSAPEDAHPVSSEAPAILEGASDLEAANPPRPPVSLMSRAERVGQIPSKPFVLPGNHAEPVQAAATHEPGDDTEQIAADERAEQEARRRQGKPVWDDREWPKMFGKVVRWVDGRAKVYGESDNFKRISQALSEAEKAWRDWQKETGR
jgi:hypothetical protein